MALHQAVNIVANPLGITLLTAIVGLLWVWRGESSGKWILLASVMATWAMGMPATVETMARWLERGFPPVRVEDLPVANDVVVLGGGVSGVPDGIDCLYPNLREGADRVWHGARIWKIRNLHGRIYCTSPDVSHSTPPFLRDLGVPDAFIVPLDGPRNTEEEAKRIKSLVSTNTCSRVYLVTSAAHMKRAIRIFCKYAPNVTVVPAATDYIVVDLPGIDKGFRWRRFVPSIRSYFLFDAVLHEYLGLVRYW